MPREKESHKVEFHVAAVCFDLDSEDAPRCLIGKRTKDRALFPDLWECGGGQLQAGETLSQALVRQMREEFGIDVEVLFPLGEYFIETPEGGIAGMKFVCSADSTQSITLDPQELVEYAWVTEDDLDEYDLIPGVKNDIEESLSVLAEC